MAHAFAIARATAEAEPVAALLTDARGEKLLAASVKSRGWNRTRHAEAELVRTFCSGRKIPRGARLFTTLQCCRMCAALLTAASEDGAGLEVHFGEHDPGPMARKTGLLGERQTPPA